MVREDLVNGAVSFLQDPSVASAPLEQRIAFLRSKNLTQEEVDLSLARSGGEGTTPATAAPSQSPQSYSYQQPPPYRQSPSQQYAGPYQNGYWPQQPPPELPRRDWRDWFIMATVVGGVGYGVYTVAKRYIYPLVAPPTPPQLEQDKANIDASFEKAFALLDQLATDTEELKTSEKSRTERLDTALAEVEAVIGQMKDASRRRDDEGRRLNDEVRGLKDLIPKAMDAQKDKTDERLKELSQEMKSLKTLINNRMTAPTPSRPISSTPSYMPSSGAISGVGNGVPEQAATSLGGQQSSEGANGHSNGSQSTERAPPSSVPDRNSTSSPYGRVLNGRAAIPAWQLAAAKKNQEVKQDTAESGTITESASA